MTRRTIYFRPKYDIYIIRFLDLKRKVSYIEPPLVRELVVDLRSCSPVQLLGLQTSWFDLFDNLETIILMSSRYDRSISECDKCNESGIVCIDCGRCLPAIQHALAVSRHIQNVVVKTIDEETYSFPYLNQLEEEITDNDSEIHI